MHLITFDFDLKIIKSECQIDKHVIACHFVTTTLKFNLKSVSTKFQIKNIVVKDPSLQNCATLNIF